MGDGADEPARRPEHPGDLPDGVLVGPDVHQHVVGDDGIEARISQKGHRRDGGVVEFDVHQRARLIGKGDLMEAAGVFHSDDVRAALRQEAREVARAAPRVQNSLPAHIA